VAYIESHQELRQSPKVRRAARLLDVHEAQIIGHLHMLWWWAVDHAFDGDLAELDHLDIADAAGWDGDPDLFVQALIDCGPGNKSGFVDVTDDGMVLHDWSTYTDVLASAREGSAKGNHKRWHVARGRTNPDCEYCSELPHTDVLIAPDIPPDSPPMSPTRRGGYPPDQTQPDQTKNPPSSPDGDQHDSDGEIHTDDPPETATDQAAEQFEQFEHFWTAYPPRNGKKIAKAKALTQWRKLTLEQRRQATRGARNLAVSDQLPKDAHRFLRRDTGGEFPFDDWQQPAAAEPGARADVDRCGWCGQPTDEHDQETHDHIVHQRQIA